MRASDHLTTILAALHSYERSNKQPAVEDPANDFEKAVNDHYELQMLLEEVKKALKPLEVQERAQRDAIAASLTAHYGDGINEGVNNYVMSNMRKLKFTYEVDRKIDESQLATARAEFDAAADKQGTFDDLLRVKYELQKRPWNKLLKGGDAYLAIAKCIVSKPKAPTLEVD